VPRFQTYFPHIDNVYSHRSTQRHKRKRFVSHYWDCRLKGRPPGTKKSTDPDKKKRKRLARERDLCDVKIKITEYSDAAEFTEQTGQRPPEEAYSLNAQAGAFFPQPAQVSGPHQWPMDSVGPSIGSTDTGQYGKKYYTIQRVNGNGGNGKGDGVPGPHKHNLEESDRVKKNSVLRWLMK
jgi:glutathione S-transferase